jgi:hypothetical protein
VEVIMRLSSWLLVLGVGCGGTDIDAKGAHSGTKSNPGPTLVTTDTDTDLTIPHTGDTATTDSGGTETTPPTSCDGASVGGACWYLGDPAESCDTVCAPHDGVMMETRSYAGSDGTQPNCWAVLDALGDSSIPFGDSPNAPGLGCYVELGERVRCTYPTTAAATYPSVRRACACGS